jgi:menaquinone-dependent protoporphyrinogen IX oxidase
MKIVIVYESMFGNTREIADAIAEGCKDLALDSVVNVNDITPVILANADAVIVGAPTHAHGLSRPESRAEAAKWAADPAKKLTLEPKAEGTGVREWLAGKPAVPAFFAAFDTRADIARILSGAASTKIDHKLHSLGAQRLVDAESFLVKDNRLEASEQARARAWGRQVAQAAEEQLEATHAV